MTHFQDNPWQKLLEAAQISIVGTDDINHGISINQAMQLFKKKNKEILFGADVERSLQYTFKWKKHLKSGDQMYMPFLCLKKEKRWGREIRMYVFACA